MAVPHSVRVVFCYRERDKRNRSLLEKEKFVCGQFFENSDFLENVPVFEWKKNSLAVCSINDEKHVIDNYAAITEEIGAPQFNAKSTWFCAQHKNRQYDYSIRLVWTVWAICIRSTCKTIHML